MPIPEIIAVFHGCVFTHKIRR